MNKKYESPEMELHWFVLDILTTSDNDVSFGGGDDNDEQNWGQYY